MKKIIPIQGMHCASCAINIEEDLKRTKGVRSASVNYATTKATIEFDEQKTDLKKLAAVVKQAGYEAVLDEVDQAAFSGHHVGAKSSEVGEWRNRFIGSSVFGLPAIYLMLSMLFPAIKISIIEDYSLLIQAVSAGLVIWFSRRIWISGWRSFTRRCPNMDSLIFIGTLAAFGYSLVVSWPQLFGMKTGEMPEVYFESAVFILIFISLGKYLEAVTKGRTGQAVQKLIGLQVKEAVVIKDGREERVLIDEVLVGDVVLVKPGDRIPVDGIILEGQSSIDEKAITGESIPVDKGKGDELIAGTINLSSVLKMESTKVGRNTMLAQIIQIVENALGTKAPVQLLADKVARYFVPVVILIAFLALVVWLLLGQSLSFAIGVFVTVLIIACPCALGLATPTAVMMGTGLAANRGILIKSSDALEKAQSIDVVVFDKTGTITKGEPEVTEVQSQNSKFNDNDILGLAASLDTNSNHPLGQAIVKRAWDDKINLDKTENFLSVAGGGVTGEIGGNKYFLGTRKLLDDNWIKWQSAQTEIETMEKNGQTVVLLADAKKIIGLIALADKIKNDSREAISRLKKMGKQVYMITGDNHLAAEAIASQAGIDNVLSEVLPSDKAAQIKKLQTIGKKVAMVGDGINDAPALAQADLGIAMGAGTDVAIETGEIILVKDNLLDAVAAIKISRYTLSKIKQNLFWAFFYNVIGIPVAAGLLYPFTGWLLSPAIAAAAMAFSSVSVVLNSLSMVRYK